MRRFGSRPRAPELRPGPVLLLLLLLVVPAPGAAQARVSTEAAFWAGAGATLAGAVLLEHSIRARTADRGEDLLVPLAEMGNRLGRVRYVAPVLGAAYVAGWMSEEDGLARGAAHTAAAVVAAGVVNGALKVGLGRQRPNAAGRADEFRPLSREDGWQSFPSGHTVVAFSVAAAVAEQAQRPWVSVASYGTAGLVGWSRLYEDRHWPSDVVGGAIVGIATSKATVRWLRGRGERTVAAQVSLLPGGVMVTIPTP